MGHHIQNADVKRKHYGRPSAWWLLAAMVGIYPAWFAIGDLGAIAGMPDQAVQMIGHMLFLPLMVLFGFKGYTMVKDSGGPAGAAACAAIGSAVMGWIAIGVIHLVIREPRDKGPRHVAGPTAALAAANGTQTKDDRYSREGLYK